MGDFVEDDRFVYPLPVFTLTYTLCHEEPTPEICDKIVIRESGKYPRQMLLFTDFDLAERYVKTTALLTGTPQLCLLQLQSPAVLQEILVEMKQRGITHVGTDLESINGMVKGSFRPIRNHIISTLRPTRDAD